MELSWKKPWSKIDAPMAGRLSNQLVSDLAPKHDLCGKKFLVVAINEVNPDDIVIQFVEDEGFAVVHLTWTSAQRHPDDKWPHTDIYSSVDEINADWAWCR